MAVVFTVVTVCLSGCLSTINQLVDRKPQQARRVACIGDSITFGKGLSNRDWNSYPAQLRRLLGYDWTVKNFGLVDATVAKNDHRAYLHSDLFKEALAFKPDVVIIALGAFDTTYPASTHNYLFDYDIKDLIDPFLSLETKPTVFLCYPVPSCGDEWTNYTISNRKIIHDIIPRIDAIAKETGLQVIDLYSALENKPELFADCVLPNQNGARRIATSVYSSIVRSQYLPASGPKTLNRATAPPQTTTMILKQVFQGLLD
nr:hypothetical protein [Desulfobulbaceae bacterium]